MHAADCQNHTMAGHNRRLGILFQGEAFRQATVVPVDRREAEHQQRDADQDDPGAIAEFGYREDHVTTVVQRAPEAVDEHLGSPISLVAQGRAAFHYFLVGLKLPLLRQRRAMPACERVNDRNTPIAYNGIKPVTLARKTMINTQATNASATMPRE